MNYIEKKPNCKTRKKKDRRVDKEIEEKEGYSPFTKLNQIYYKDAKPERGMIRDLKP